METFFFFAVLFFGSFVVVFSFLKKIISDEVLLNIYFVTGDVNERTWGDSRGWLSERVSH